MPNPKLNKMKVSPQNATQKLNLASAKGCDEVLKFWVARKDKYPRLFQLSRQILCAPASSAGVERLFSVAGFLLDDRALNINDDYFEARLLTKANRDLIPVVKKRFKIDDITHNESNLDVHCSPAEPMGSVL